MTFKNILTAISVLTVAATASFAQVGSRPQVYSEMVPPDRGTAEIGIALDAKLDSPTSTNLSLRFMPYINRNVQVGGNLDYLKSGSFSGGFLEVRADYNFVSSDETTVSRSVPYAGLSYGGSFGDQDGSAFGIHGGLKHFVSNDVSVFGELSWRTFSEDIDDDDNDLRLMIGLNTYLRR